MTRILLTRSFVGSVLLFQIARLVDISNWHAALTPEGKQSQLQHWLEGGHAVAMVRDGLNDGPVLAAASVGIAAGGATDLAREAADNVLPEGRLARLPWLIRLSRRVQKSIDQNLAWALGYNAIGLLLAEMGLLRPVAAAALMAGSSMIIIVNSLRLDRYCDEATLATENGFGGYQEKGYQNET